MSHNVENISPPSLPRPTARPRDRYALSVHGCGFIARLVGRYHFLYTPDPDAAQQWESPGAVAEWLKSLPDGHAKRLRDRPMFVVLVATSADRIVAAWNLVPEPVMEQQETSR